MMEKTTLRKADIFSASVIIVFGLWVFSEAMGMPMRDSYGGVNNVWYVSPALFPLLVGGMIAFLGILLLRTALTASGIDGARHVLAWVKSPAFRSYLNSPPLFRFYAIVVLFVGLVFIHIPRVDFFLAAVLFLVIFISIFYLDDDRFLRRILGLYVIQLVLFLAFLATGLSRAMTTLTAFPNDWLVIVFIAVTIAVLKKSVRSDARKQRKMRTCLILAVAAPFIIGPVFKYLLLVPMPFEGLVVTFMDAVWYWDF